MRHLIWLLLLTALVVGWQRPVIAQAVTGIVSADADFDLAFPNQNSPKACVHIPQDVIGTGPNRVRPGTLITLRLVTESPDPNDWVEPFKSHPKPWFRPIFDFSAVPPFNLGGPNSQAVTVAMCVHYPPSFDATTLTLARGVDTDGDGDLETMDFWPRVTPCKLRCEPAPMPTNGSAIGYLGQLFAGSPFSPTPLYALPEPEGGLGGKGGSGSPFAAAVE